MTAATGVDPMLSLTATTDPDAAAFFADARMALTSKPAPTLPTEITPGLPADWPITPAHTGTTLSRAQLHASRGHALRISHDWRGARQAMWVGRWRGGDWSILQGYVGQPASALTSPHTWDATVRELTKYVHPGRYFGGDNFTIDDWRGEFAIVCLAHGSDCHEHDGGHNYVQRRTLARYPEGTYRPCGEGAHDGAYQYRFQVDGRWRLRYGCRRHHHQLLTQHLDTADGTVSVIRMDDHLGIPVAGQVAARQYAPSHMRHEETCSQFDSRPLSVRHPAPTRRAVEDVQLPQTEAVAR